MASKLNLSTVQILPMLLKPPCSTSQKEGVHDAKIVEQYFEAQKKFDCYTYSVSSERHRL